MTIERLLRPPKESYFLLGARGTGKTTWLRQNYKDAFTIDLLDESSYQNFLMHPGEFADRIRSVPKSKWIIVDEIQRLPNLLNEVHRHIELDKRKFALCGSSARKLKHAGVNLLGGRAELKTMHPFLSWELKDHFELQSQLMFGSIPIVWSAENKAVTLGAYVQSYLKNEIQAEALVRNLPAFARFLPVAALFHGQVLNISSLARDAGVHRNTIAGYLEILEETLMAFRLSPYEGRLRVKEKSHPKFYLFDCGIVRTLKNQSGSIALEEKGSLFEGWVISSVRALNAYRPFFDEMYYWSPTSSKVEVDLLLKRGKSFTAIEIKASDRVRPEDLKGIKAVGELDHVKQRIVVYLGKELMKTQDGIEIVPLAEFLARMWDPKAKLGN